MKKSLILELVQPKMFKRLRKKWCLVITVGSIRLQGFLQIPNLEDIKKTPNDPYDFPTGGRVHGGDGIMRC